ncbi:MAG TPA: imidazole glycerol phosphate synthase subunit HisH [Rikenellaceae bacterium]|nr:MAG: imidazole glycerol phosphate synthase, glutamine amidotransferase subunit [Bacteroidetes bacterium GWE2_40_15]HBZ26128.1 imidazole glycerol phosphate synthase subunit HisH [Rikenellaceae bacterium]
MITIIDYGCGNVKAFVNVFNRFNIPVVVANSKEQVRKASSIILPGVGAFDFVMKTFNESGLRDIVENKVLVEKTPVLGICAGMQILADSSEEGKEKGLSWIKGNVRLFDTSKIPYVTKVPHMGWNQISPNDSQLFIKIEDNSRFYFVHSYYFEVAEESNSIAKSIYGLEFTSAVRNNNIFGVQFHPEKSHNNGIQLLLNFSKI